MTSILVLLLKAPPAPPVPSSLASGVVASVLKEQLSSLPRAELLRVSGRYKILFGLFSHPPHKPAKEGPMIPDKETAAQRGECMRPRPHSPAQG